MELPGKNASAELVYITAIKRQSATAQDIQDYTEALHRAQTYSIHIQFSFNYNTLRAHFT